MFAKKEKFPVSFSLIIYCNLYLVRAFRYCSRLNLPSWFSENSINSAERKNGVGWTGISIMHIIHFIFWWVFIRSRKVWKGLSSNNNQIKYLMRISVEIVPPKNDKNFKNLFNRDFVWLAWNLFKFWIGGETRNTKFLLHVVKVLVHHRNQQTTIIYLRNVKSGSH